MNANPRFSQPRRAGARKPANQAQRELIHRGGHDGSAPPGPETPAADRRAKHIAAAEWSLGEAYASARAAGIDRDTLDDAFAMALDCITEAKQGGDQARRDLAAARYERYQARHRRLNPDSVTPDVPGLNLCPDPRAVHTPADFMDTLRMYRIWAGKPSYRVMERQCDRRFAASTICTALQGGKLPSLDMVQAIITACGGSEEHHRAFTSAWRRFMLPHQDAGQLAAQPPPARVLYPVR
jgi:hypothetical protein